MDKTNLFKAVVMTIKVQRKDQLSAKVSPKERKGILKSSIGAKGDEFSRQARDVCQKITALRDVLLEHRSSYMRIGQHLKNCTQMTDEQRDVIDRETEKFILHYVQQLSQMRKQWRSAKRKPQHHEHIDAVLDLLVSYLRSIEIIYNEQRNYRVQYELEMVKMLKLASDKTKIPVKVFANTNGKTSVASSDDNQKLNESQDSSDIEWTDDWDIEDGANKPSKKNHTTNNSNVSIDSKSPKIKSQIVALDDDLEKSQQLVDEEVAAKELSPEDIQMFEEENIHLLEEFQGVTQEVEQIEKNVVEIAQLQDILTEKVSLQQYSIDRIINAVVGSTENVKDANEQIKQAIQRNAGLRVWTLFFMLVMSFTLLFLDWYYD